MKDILMQKIIKQITRLGQYLCLTLGLLLLSSVGWAAKPPVITTSPGSVNLGPSNNYTQTVRATNSGGPAQNEIVLKQDFENGTKMLNVNKQCQKPLEKAGGQCQITLSAKKKAQFEGGLEFYTGGKRAGRINVVAKSPLAITVSGPADPVFVGQPFTLQVTNKSNSALEGLEPAYNQANKNEVKRLTSSSKDTCGDELAPGKSCQFRMEGVSRDLGDNVLGLGAQSNNHSSPKVSVRFKNPQFTMSANKTTVAPGDQLELTVKPQSGAVLHQVEVDKSSLQNLQVKSNNCQGEQSKICTIQLTANNDSQQSPAKVKVTSQYTSEARGETIPMIALSSQGPSGNPNTNTSFNLTVTNQGSSPIKQISTDFPDYIVIQKNKCTGQLGSGKSCYYTLVGNKSGDTQLKVTGQTGQTQTNTSTSIKLKGPSFNLTTDEAAKVGSKIKAIVTPKDNSKLQDLHAVSDDLVNVKQTTADKQASSCLQGSGPKQSQCFFQFTVTNDQSGKKAKVSIVSHAATEKSTTFDVEAFKLSASTTKPYIGTKFHLTVTNTGSAKLNGLGFKGLPSGLTQQSGSKACGDNPLSAGDQCSLYINSNDKSLANKQKKLTVTASNANSQTQSVTFQQPAISADFTSDGPFKSGDTVKVKVKPQSDKYILHGVTAAAQNGQLKPVTSQDDSGKTCSNDSSCTFAFQVKDVGKLSTNKPAKIQISSNYATQTVTKTADIAAFSVKANSDNDGQPYLGKQFSVTVTNKGSVKLNSVNLSVDNQDDYGITNKCKIFGVGPGKTCKVTIKPRSKKVSGQQVFTFKASSAQQQQLTENIQKPQFSLANVPPAAKVGNTIQIQVKPKTSDEVLQSLSPNSLTNLQFLSNSDKTTCDQNNQQGSCKLAFKVLNNDPGKAAKVTVSSDYADSVTSSDIQTVAMKASWPSSKLYLGTEFQVGIQNQGSATLSQLKISGDGITTNSDDTSCGSSLGSSDNDSCHFSVTSSQASSQLTVSAQSQSGDVNLSASKKLSFNKTDFTLSTSKSAVKPGDTFKLYVTPSGNNMTLHKLNPQATNGQATLQTDNQTTATNESTSGVSQCPKPQKGSVSSKCYYQYQVNSADKLNSGKPVNIQVSSAHGKQAHSQKVDIQWMTSDLSNNTIGTGQTTTLTIHNKGSQKLTGLSAGLSDGLQLKNNGQASDDSSSCSDKLQGGQSCSYTITTNMPTNTSQTVQPSSDQTGKGQEYDLTVVKPKLTITHTLIPGPDSGDLNNYFVIKNATSDSNQYKPLMQFDVNKASSQPLGDGVTVNVTSERTALSSDQPNLCSDSNYSLKPGQSCRISLTAQHDAYGTTFAQASGNFTRGSVDIPLNVVPTRIKVYGRITHYISNPDDSQVPFAAGGIGKNPSSPPRLQLKNEGPFTLNGISLSGIGDQFFGQGSCNGQSQLKVNQSCPFEWQNPNPKDHHAGDLDITAHNSILNPIQTFYMYFSGYRQYARAGTGVAVYNAIWGLPKLPGVTTKTQAKHYTTHLNQAQFLAMRYYTAQGKGKLAKPTADNTSKLIDNQINAQRQCSKISVNDSCAATISAKIIPYQPLTSSLQIGHVHYPGHWRGHPTGYAKLTRSLVAAGDFTYVKGTANTTAIARYDANQNWHYLATLSAGDSVNALMQSRDLYVGGQFQQITHTGKPKTVNNIARWNGAEWYALGKGVSGDNASVNALASMTNDKHQPTQIIVGGHFSKAGSTDTHNLALWDVDKQKWHVPMKYQPKNGSVNALLVGPNGHIWVGGDFTTIGVQKNVNGLAAYTLPDNNGDGGNWSAFGKNLQSINNQPITIYSLTYLPKLGNNGSIVAAGNFKVCDNNDECSDGLAIYNVSKQDGWKPFQPGAENQPQLKAGDVGIKTVKLDTVSSHKQLLVGGTFHLNGKQTHFASYQFSGSQWQAGPTQPNGIVNDQVLTSNNLYIGGAFSQLVPENIDNIAKTKINSNNDFWKALSNQSSEVEGSGDVIRGGSVKAMTLMDNIKAYR